jgi:hypothetical protein
MCVCVCMCLCVFEACVRDVFLKKPVCLKTLFNRTLPLGHSIPFCQGHYINRNVLLGACA